MPSDQLRNIYGVIGIGDGTDYAGFLKDVSYTYSNRRGVVHSVR